MKLFNSTLNLCVYMQRHIATLFMRSSPLFINFVCTSQHILFFLFSTRRADHKSPDFSNGGTRKGEHHKSRKI